MREDRYSTRRHTDGIDLHATMNAGAFVASGMNVTRRVGQAPVSLTCPNARFEGMTVYTNRPAGGSFRGLGAPLDTLRWRS
jgi:CO/xanthine dehydrogenase Mo-binding subunit